MTPLGGPTQANPNPDPAPNSGHVLLREGQHDQLKPDLHKMSQAAQSLPRTAQGAEDGPDRPTARAAVPGLEA